MPGLYLPTNWNWLRDVYRYQNHPISVYKILTATVKTPIICSNQYGYGYIIYSRRASPDLQPSEIVNRRVGVGLIFQLEKPRKLPIKYDRNLFCEEYPFRGTCGYRVFEFWVNPEDIIAVNKYSLATTKAIIRKEV